MRRPEQARIALAIPGGVPERLNGAVSKTVVRASVPRVRIPPPPLLWLGRSQFAASRSSTKGETSRDRYSGVNERQRTSTTASAAAISFPHLSPVARASTGRVAAPRGWKFLPAPRGSPIGLPVRLCCGTSALRMPLPTRRRSRPAMATLFGSRPQASRRPPRRRPHSGGSAIDPPHDGRRWVVG
jgi:hypothetical protein